VDSPGNSIVLHVVGPSSVREFSALQPIECFGALGILDSTHLDDPNEASKHIVMPVQREVQFQKSYVRQFPVRAPPKQPTSEKNLRSIPSGPTSSRAS
jgi:hypothetical protein